MPCGEVVLRRMGLLGLVVVRGQVVILVVVEPRGLGQEVQVLLAYWLRLLTVAVAVLVLWQLWRRTEMLLLQKPLMLLLLFEQVGLLLLFLQLLNSNGLLALLFEELLLSLLVVPHLLRR